MKQYLKEKLNIELSPQQQQQLETYYNFLVSENEKYNLTAITEKTDVYEKHFVDSMLGSVALPQGATLCDIGTGAGFPSLPLKIARNDLQVTLVDSLEKRINFCKMLCEKLCVDAKFFHDRAEDFATHHREQYDAVCSRAVAPLNILLEYTSAVVKVGGIVVAYKTDESEVENAKNAEKLLGLKYEKHFDFVLPSGASRCLLIYRKVKTTPTKYPRGQNKPRKLPL